MAALALMLAQGVVVWPGTLAAQEGCGCTDEIADQPVVFVGEAIGEVGRLDLTGEPSQIQWSFVAQDVYAGDVALEQFVGIPMPDAGAAACPVQFDRNTVYLVGGRFLDHPDARSTVVAVTGCTVTADVGRAASLGLEARPPPGPEAAIQGAGRLQPSTSDDQLDPLTLIVFFALVGATTAVVWTVWTRR
ncbi:MAG: hypothetical protein HKN26_03350 [Acidimicrobiales bacterium]|nr:hypothetical protein [Acidimicrobiales bacterium]